MTTLIEIECSIAQEQVALTAVEENGKDTGDLLIGRRVDEEKNAVLLIVRLMHPTSVSKYTLALRRTIQNHHIASFRFVTCDLVNISFGLSVDPQEQMQDFPLHPDESWFLSIHDQHQAYVCISRPVMGAKQAAWLLKHEVLWTYVDAQKIEVGK